MRIPVHRVDSVTAEVDAVQHRIASRAEELHDRKDSGIEEPLEDWLEAERDTIWRPPIEVQQTDGAYVIEAAVAGVEPKQIDVRVAPHDLLITAEVHHRHMHTGDALVCEFSAGPLFRSYHFAHPVDPGRAKADYTNGLLRITAPIVPGRTP